MKYSVKIVFNEKPWCSCESSDWYNETGMKL